MKFQYVVAAAVVLVVASHGTAYAPPGPPGEPVLFQIVDPVEVEGTIGVEVDRPFSQVVRLRLTESNFYEVPSDKVLVIENILYTDSWEGEARRIIVRNKGLNSAGPVIDTSIPSFGPIRSFSPPLVLPAGIGLSYPGSEFFGGIYVYGRLTDAPSALISGE